MINLCIHHTAVSHALQATQLYAVNRYHKQNFNMASRTGWYVCYNDFIDVSGTTTHTRDYDEEACAVVGHNCDIQARCDTISVCVAGNFDIEYPTQAERVALVSYIERMRARYPNIFVTFHNKLQAERTCPGALFTNDYLRGLQTPPADLAKTEVERLGKQLDTLRALLARLLALLRK